MKRFISYFFRGLILVVPATVTLYVLYIIFTLFAKIDQRLGFPIPGLGFLITIALVTTIGFFGSNIVAKRALNFVDGIFAKLPIMKLLYSATKDIVTIFLGDKRGFEKPVCVTPIPGTDVKVIGFITNESLDAWGMPGEVAVYLPQSYNFAGHLIVVPKKQVALINAKSSEVMAFIVSGGVTGTK